MLPSTRAERVRLIVAVCVLGVLIGCGVWLAVSGQLQVWCSRLQDMFQGKDQLRAYVQSWGALAPVAFMSVQSLQVLIAPIPGELTGVAGGFIFGAWKSTIYSTVGLTLGSAAAFLAARIVGQPLLKLVTSADTMTKLEYLTRRRGIFATFILFIVPGFPKDLFSYFLGLSPMRFTTFVIVCAAGRLPGTALLGASGSALFKENWYVLGIISCICIGVFLAAYWKKESIKRWLHHR
ncbi:MAG: TVP38/TMEM64 family protein [Desulfomonile tiedjei]|uniref:TVP38/TMEM64 family membrane protein n=1 Tax=Desulfomonile tiedjei TaxID=2358 RepID=A0A9D6Z1R9_9BACT|nr:TVP38/TMEM64 family protein [Desulfomonile tiedjei]